MNSENPHRVVGLAYQPGQRLPQVILKGVGSAAAFIEREFLRHRPSYRVIENEQLADSLFRLPMDSDISPDLYELVALILVHVFAVEAKLKEDMRGGSN